MKGFALLRKNITTFVSRKGKRFLCCCFLALAICSAFFIASPHAFAAQAHATAPSCTYWAIDTESVLPVTGYTSSGKHVTYTWTLTIKSLRTCVTGAYTGKASDEVCLHEPAGIGWANIQLYNEWYTSGNYINESITYEPNTNNQGGTYCTYSGSWSVPSGSSAGVLGEAHFPDGTDACAPEYISTVER